MHFSFLKCMHSLIPHSSTSPVVHPLPNIASDDVLAVINKQVDWVRNACILKSKKQIQTKHLTIFLIYIVKLWYMQNIISQNKMHAFLHTYVHSGNIERVKHEWHHGLPVCLCACVKMHAFWSVLGWKCMYLEVHAWKCMHFEVCQWSMNENSWCW